MELGLWIFAWIAGALSLFLIADMIAADLANSRATARLRDRASETRHRLGSRS